MTLFRWDFDCLPGRFACKRISSFPFSLSIFQMFHSRVSSSESSRLHASFITFLLSVCSSKTRTSPGQSLIWTVMYKCNQINPTSCCIQETLHPPNTVVPTCLVHAPYWWKCCTNDCSGVEICGGLRLLVYEASGGIIHHQLSSLPHLFISTPPKDL